MPTILTHPAVALPFVGRVPRRVLVCGFLGSIIPDADVVAFAFGIPYEHTFGHRGFTHSIAFAALFALIATLLVRGRLPAFVFVLVCTLSHAVLDALTDGGLGIAFFSPFSNERYFFPWQPIRVSPLGAGFFSGRGLETLKSEVVWVWGPCVAVALAAMCVRAVVERRRPRRLS
jgi:inner membrane protein